MAYGEPSGDKNYDPFASDLLTDAFDRAEIFAPETRHLTSARRSFNLLLNSDWSTRGINLWEMSLLATPLLEGVATYTLTRDVVAVFDTYRRQYQMNALASATMDFTTTLNSKTVLVGLTNAGVVVDGYVQIGMQVSVGGVVLFGPYQVQSTPDVNSFTILATAAATAGISHGGVAPIFSTTANSSTVGVHFPNHGYVAGVPFQVPVATTVGGLTLSGMYTVTVATDADHFSFVAGGEATSTDTATENGGEAYIASQNLSGGYTDILMTSISRNDYAAQSNKTAPGAPTNFWTNKQLIPEVTIWPVTDNTGPYEMRSWVLRTIDTVNPSGGETLDLPPAMLYACTLDLARDIAMKFNKGKYALLKQEAAEAWDRAAATNVENSSTFIVPQFANG